MRGGRRAYRRRVRQVGVVWADRSPGRRGHACCLHDGAQEYRRHLADFFTEGLRQGLRVAYTGFDGVEAARADLADVGDLDRLLAEGALRILSFGEVYGPFGEVDGRGAPVDPELIVATCAAATEEALAAGFRGLRLSADVTELVRTPEQRDAFARAEFLADRYMAEHPLSALCGYQRELGNDTVTEFASLHTAEPSENALFRVFGCVDGALGLAGEFDLVSVPVLNRLLTRLRTGADSGALVIDMAAVDYIDHRLLLTLSHYAQANGIALSLRSAPRLAARLIELLQVSNLQLVES
ncbi:MAG: MEDS domain-containing protein [Blastococcus sp.]